MKKINLENYNYKRNLLFCGKPGVGKTYKAKQLLEQYKAERYDRVLDKYSITDAHFKQLVKNNILILRRPEDYSVGLENYPLEIMTRCELLLYDDIGVSDTTEAYLRDITYILDTRIERGLTTIFTTNLTSEELKQKLNEMILSRLLYNCDVVIMKGDDKRRQTTRYFENIF